MTTVIISVRQVGDASAHVHCRQSATSCTPHQRQQFCSSRCTCFAEAPPPSTYYNSCSAPGPISIASDFSSPPSRPPRRHRIAVPADYRGLERDQPKQANITALPYKPAWKVGWAEQEKKLKYEDRDGKFKTATALLTSEGGLVVIKGKARRVIRKVLQKACFVNAIEALSVGFAFDFGKLSPNIEEQGSSALSSLLDGRYGLDGEKWALTMIMRADIKIQRNSSISKFVPTHAKDDKGFVLTGMLSARLASQMAYLYCNKGGKSRTPKYYWMPGRGLPVFQVTRKKRGGEGFYEFTEIPDFRPSMSCKKCRLKIRTSIE